jgi:hypothetical protein
MSTRDANGLSGLSWPCVYQSKVNVLRTGTRLNCASRILMSVCWPTDFWNFGPKPAQTPALPKSSPL